MDRQGGFSVDNVHSDGDGDQEPAVVRGMNCLGKGLAERKGKHWGWGDGSSLVKAFVMQA